MPEDDLRLAHGGVARPLLLGEGRAPVPPRSGWGLEPLVGLDLGPHLEVGRVLVLGHQVEDEGGDDLLAGPELLRLEDGGGQGADLAGEVDQGRVDVLHVLLAGEEPAAHGHLHPRDDVVL